MTLKPFSSPRKNQQITYNETFRHTDKICLLIVKSREEQDLKSLQLLLTLKLSDSEQPDSCMAL